MGDRVAGRVVEHVGHPHAPVTRVTLDDATTVIVKRRRVDRDEEGYGGPSHHRREQVGLRLASDSGVTPRFYAGDWAAGVVVMEDVGDHPMLIDVLLGDDRDAAVAAFVGLGRAAGRLHAATRDVEAEYDDAMRALGAEDVARERLGMWPGVERWDRVEQDALALQLPDARVARADIENVKARLLAPSPFGALIHLDLNPTNVMVCPDGVRLVDLEGATFGFPWWDASFLHFPFPNYSPHWSTVPDDVVALADAAYRDALGADVDHDELLAFGATAALAIRLHRLPKLAADEPPSHERWRRRAQLVQHIGVFVRLCERGDCLPLLRAWCAELAEAMCARWEDAATPPPSAFPAFR